MREELLFDDGWLFHRGELSPPLPRDKGPIYCQSKTERMVWGPASRHYDAVPDDFNTEHDHEIRTDLWEPVTLPHDFVISQTPSPDENNTLGYFAYGSGWYRKTFRLPQEDAKKRLTLLFEGVATGAAVYLNGCLLGRNFCGYNSFELPISDFARFGDGEDCENVLAVHVATDEHEGWWYEGGGIYRHVRLRKTAPVAVDLWGVYAMPYRLEDGSWAADVETTVVNDRFEDAAVTAETVFLDETGAALARASGEGTIPARGKAVLRYRLTAERPRLWDVDSPVLYTVETRLYSGGEELDRSRTRTGFRTVRLDPDRGLFLNGRPLKLKGVCGHQDCGLTGKAVADNVQRYKIGVLKEMGANGYRTTHYPQSESIMDALDELGFLVMDETRWFSSARESLEQLEMLVRRDRNRPSVVFWSVGNEEPSHLTETGRRVCKAMAALVRRLDPLRFVTTAVSNDPLNAVVYDDLDVIGVNYNLECYDELHRRYPQLPFVSSECCATGTTRGWYGDDCPSRAFFGAWDKDATKWFLGREKTWKFLCERNWAIGCYQWIGFEHRGETVWPRLSSQSGAIDLYLQKKDAFYQNQSHWVEDRPLVHLLPHWSFAGFEGEPVRVFAYTNCEELELFLNGESLGCRRIERYGHGEWIVPYAPGELRVEGRNGGKIVCCDVRRTAGRAARLRLRLENEVTANGRDVAIVTCLCEDENGVEVPDASPFVEFSTNRLGKLLATGSDITDHTPPQLPSRRMRAGRITAAVQVGGEPGELKLYARADGLAGAVLTIAV